MECKEISMTTRFQTVCLVKNCYAQKSNLSLYYKVNLQSAICRMYINCNQLKYAIQYPICWVSDHWNHVNWDPQFYIKICWAPIHKSHIFLDSGVSYKALSAPFESVVSRFRGSTAHKAPKAWALHIFWVSIRTYKKQLSKKICGRVLGLAWLKFAVAALIEESSGPQNPRVHAYFLGQYRIREFLTHSL